MLADIAAAIAPVEKIDGFFVRPETIFDRDSVFDAVAVYLLTPRHLVIVMTDVTYELSSAGDFVTTTQVVELANIKDYQIVRRRVLDGPEAGAISSIQMRLRWGNGWAVDIRPSACDDPHCEADHGYVGLGQGDDGEIMLDTSLDDDVFAQGLLFVEQLAARLVR